MEFLHTQSGLPTTIFVVLGLATMTACGPSEKERDRVAAVTCAEIAETRNFESARRVRLINDAREKLGAKPMLRGDVTIVIADLYGICDALVKGDEQFDAALEVATRPEREEQQRREEQQQKLVDWFNENFSLQVKNLHIVMRTRTDFESRYSFLGKVNYGFVGELEVECSSEERCDQLARLGYIMADISPGGESESITLLIHEQHWSKKSDKTIAPSGALHASYAARTVVAPSAQFVCTLLKYNRIFSNSSAYPPNYRPKARGLNAVVAIGRVRVRGKLPAVLLRPPPIGRLNGRSTER